MNIMNVDTGGELQWFHETCLDLSRERTPVGVLRVLLDRVLTLTSAASGAVRIEQDTLAHCAAEQTAAVTYPVTKRSTPGKEDPVSGSETAPGSETVKDSLVVYCGAEHSPEAGADLTIPLHLDGCTIGILQLYNFTTVPVERALVLAELLCEQTAQLLPGILRQEIAGREKPEPNAAEPNAAEPNAAEPNAAETDATEPGTTEPDLKEILDALDEPVYIRDRTGQVRQANRAFYDFFRVPLAAMDGASVETNADKLRQALPHYQEQAEDDEPAKYLLEFVYDRPERIFQESRLPLANGLQVCRVREITEPRRLYAQLLHIEKPAALGELIGGVTHELNNPLATIIGYAQLLETEDNLPPRVQRGLHHIHLEAQRASQIVTSLRAFAGRTVVEKAQLDINELLHVLGQMKFSQFSEEDIQYNEEFDELIPAVWGDAPQLQQAFLKIMNNVLQAFREAGNLNAERSKKLQIVTRRLPGTENGKPWVQVEFIDNGPGIAAEYIERVFEPFFTTRPLGRGAGLGLTLASRIVAEHDGRISIESEYGQGTRVTIVLPGSGALRQETARAENKAAALSDLVARQETRIATTKAGAAKETAFASSLLIVGNTPAGVTPIAAALSEAYQVTVCYGGVEATALLASGEYDLIVVMAEAPRENNGAANEEPSFLEYLQTIPSDLLPKLLFIVKGVLPPSARDFLDGTAAHVLTAPIEPEALRETVWQLLEEEI